MHIDDAYRLLEVSPAASDEEIRSAHRDLTKVWHPDRFAQDPAMQRRAEEKLKAINEAFEAIRDARAGRYRRWSAPPPPPSSADPAAAVRQHLRRLLSWTFTCIGLGLLILIRRPTLGGLITAGILFAVAFALILRIKKLEQKI